MSKALQSALLPEAPHFRSLLQAELAKRCRANPNYSLRSFARSLRVEASALSQMLNGKRPITAKMKLRLGSALGLPADLIARIPCGPEADARSAKYQQLTLDAFAIVSDWYHYAILELTYLEDFEPSARWVGRRIGITASEANMAVERLFRLGLLRESEGTWVDASEGGALTHLHPANSSDAARKYQRQLLELSSRAVQEVSLELRNHTSITLCFDPADMPRAMRSIADFRRAFGREFQPKGAAKEVYQLQISLFPLTRIEKE